MTVQVPPRRSLLGRGLESFLSLLWVILPFSSLRQGKPSSKQEEEGEAVYWRTRFLATEELLHLTQAEVQATKRSFRRLKRRQITAQARRLRVRDAYLRVSCYFDRLLTRLFACNRYLPWITVLLFLCSFASLFSILWVNFWYLWEPRPHHFWYLINDLPNYSHGQCQYNCYNPVSDEPPL